MESREVLSLKLFWQPLETTCVLGFKADEKPIYAGNLRYTLSSLPVTVYGEFCHHETDDLRQYLLGFQFDPSFEIFDGNIQAQFEYFRNENSYQHEVEAYYDYYPGKTPTLGELLRWWGLRVAEKQPLSTCLVLWIFQRKAISMLTEKIWEALPNRKRLNIVKMRSALYFNFSTSFQP